MIVPMSKITLLGLSRQKETLLKQLMRFGCVDISDISDASAFLSEEDRREYQQEQQIAIPCEEMRVLTEEALQLLKEYAPDQKKTGLFYQKRQISETSFSASLMEETSAYGAAKKITELGRRMDRLKNEKNQLENQLDNIKPWEKLPFAFDSRGTRTTKAYAGLLPKTEEIESLRKVLDSLELVSFAVLFENSEYYYVCLIFHRSVEQEVKKTLREYSFNRVRFEKQKGTYREVSAELKNRLRETEQQFSEVSAKLGEYGGAREQLQLLSDYLTYRIDREDAANHLFSTQNLFVLDGYLPQEKAEAVKNKLEEKFTVSVSLREPEPEAEEVPTLLKNNKLVAPYETITEMYSTPSYTEIDPNPLMAPFYFLFFGMMVSDAGYGLLTALICWFVVKKYKPEGFMGQIITMLGYCGFSTLFWGVMFGGYFGDTISIVTNGAVNIPPVLFNPMDEPMQLLILSFALGVIHIFVGIGIKVYLCFRRKLYAEGIANGCWIFIIAGLPMLLLKQTSLAGKIFVIAGVAALILTKGWEEKNVFKKIFTGISGLMDITGYFSDILSYSRLLALGLSTGVIASVVNTMGFLGGNTVSGWITFVIVFIIGHTFNMVINLLGAYVHTSRLQYVEFFGKFFEGGGVRFTPLQIHSKYTRLSR